MRRIIITLIFFFLFSLSFGQGMFELNNQEDNLLNQPFIQEIIYYKDSTNKLTLADLSNKKFEKIYSYTSATFNKDFTYWFKINLVNKSEESKLWFFEVLDPHIQYINVYQISDGDTIRFNPTGFKIPFSSRFSNHKNFIFPIRFHNSDSTLLYFSFKNNYYSNLTVSLRPAKKFIDYALNEYYLLGIFYGILLIMATYNFFLFFSTRERVYLYYVAYVLCYCINAFREDGIGFQYVWPNSPELNPLIEIFAPVLLIISFVFYSKKFLFLDSYAKKLAIAINISLIIYCTLFFLNYFILNISWMRYLYLFPFALIYIAGILAWKKGNKSAVYFLMAFSFLVLCFTIFVLRVANIIPTNIYTVYALNFGFLIEVVLFSYALGQRLKIEKEEKAKTDQMLILQLRENEKLKDLHNKELEIKVRERTTELAQALSELKIKNEKIEEFNKLLEQDNKVLNQDIKDITKARLMLKDLTLEEFKKIYQDEESCLKYLAEIKWVKSYTCKKCDNKVSSPGKTPFSRRCTKCGYDESVTSFTLFHNSKIPITTSFYLVYLIFANKGISSHELSEKLGLRQKTCWAFKKKVMEAINNSKSPKFTSKEWGKIFYS